MELAAANSATREREGNDLGQLSFFDRRLPTMAALIFGVSLGLAGLSAPSVYAADMLGSKPDTTTFFDKHFRLGASIKSVGGSDNFTGVPLELHFKFGKSNYSFFKFGTGYNSLGNDLLLAESGLKFRANDRLTLNPALSWQWGSNAGEWSKATISLGPEWAFAMGKDYDFLLSGAVGVTSEKHENSPKLSIELSVQSPGSK